MNNQNFNQDQQLSKNNQQKTTNNQLTNILKMKKIVLTAAVVVLISIFSSCSPDSDTEKPAITIITPEVEQVFAPGAVINIKFELRDNDALRSFKIDIHENDGHNHGPRVGRSTNAVFSYEKTEQISSNVYRSSREVTIPTDAELGEYDLGIIVIDASGNEEKKYITIDID